MESHARNERDARPYRAADAAQDAPRPFGPPTGTDTTGTDTTGTDTKGHTITASPDGARSAPRSLVVPTIALLVAAGLGVSALVGGSEDDTDGERPAVEPAHELERREPGDPLAIGDPDAPVTMIEWSDFQCPFCGAFARETKPELIDRYVEDGTLRMEWRDFPVLGEESQTAALAARAAGAQDAFWPLHDEIFAEEREIDAGELDRASLVAMAERLELDVERFERDLDDASHLDAVEHDLQAGREVGVTGTPAFLVNGELIAGAQPLEVFVDAIERALAEPAAS